MNNREIDALVAEKVMGWIPWAELRGDYTYIVWQKDEKEPWKRSRHDDPGRYTRIKSSQIDSHKHINILDETFRPSTNIADAWKVVEKMLDRHYTEINHDHLAWDVTFIDVETHEKFSSHWLHRLETQICLAALKAHGVRINDGLELQGEIKLLEDE